MSAFWTVILWVFVICTLVNGIALGLSVIRWAWRHAVIVFRWRP